MEQLGARKLNGRNLAFIVFAYAIYMVYAFYFNTFGTNATVMMAFYNITSAEQGLILTVQSVGGLAAAIFLALQGERFNKINALGLGALLVGVAGIAIGFAPPYFLLILIVIVAGIGCTFNDVMLNSLIPEVYPKRKNTLLPIAHAFYGIGAMVTPLFVTAVVDPEVFVSFAVPFLIIGIASTVIFVVYMILGKSIMPETPYADMAAVRKQVSGDPAEIFKTKKAWLFLIAGVLYFSFQVGTMSWLPTYCREIGMDFNLSGAMLTAFFGGSLVMRFISPLVLKKMTAQRAYIVFSILSAACMVAGLLTGNSMLMVVLVAVAGFMQGNSVALLVLIATEAFPHRVASASSISFIALNVATMTAPLWMGEMAGRTGFLLPLLMGSICMLASALLISFIERNSRKSKK